MNEMYPAIIGGFTTTMLAGFSGWFFTKRKYAAEALSIEVDVKTKEIDNDIKVSDYYKGLLDDLGGRYESKFTDIVAVYEKKTSILQDEITLLKRKNIILTQENAALRKRIKELEI